jgi:hypothetical protein
MYRSNPLLWISWIGACAIGGFAGSRLPGARASLPIWLAFAALGSCWAITVGALLKRQISHVIAWIIDRTLVPAMYISFLAGFVALGLSNLISDRLTALLWAAGTGAILGLASGLLIRPYLSTERYRKT